MLYFGWLKGSADHVSKELEKDSASRSAGKGENTYDTYSFNYTDKEVNGSRTVMRDDIHFLTFLLI